MKKVEVLLLLLLLLLLLSLLLVVMLEEEPVKPTLILKHLPAFVGRVLRYLVKQILESIFYLSSDPEKCVG